MRFFALDFAKHAASVENMRHAMEISTSCAGAPRVTCLRLVPNLPLQCFSSAENLH